MKKTVVKNLVGISFLVLFYDQTDAKKNQVLNPQSKTEQKASNVTQNNAISTLLHLVSENSWANMKKTKVERMQTQKREAIPGLGRKGS